MPRLWHLKTDFHEERGKATMIMLCTITQGDTQGENDRSKGSDELEAVSQEAEDAQRRAAQMLVTAAIRRVSHDGASQRLEEGEEAGEGEGEGGVDDLLASGYKGT